MATQAKTTIDHDTIREWVEERGGQPSVVASTHGKGEGGILRIDFGEKDENLESVSWDEFFRIFDERELAFLYEDEGNNGSESYFCKFVARSEGDADEYNELDVSPGDESEDLDVF